MNLTLKIKKYYLKKKVAILLKDPSIPYKDKRKMQQMIRDYEINELELLSKAIHKILLKLYED